MPPGGDMSIVIQAIDQASSVMRQIAGSVSGMVDSTKRGLGNLSGYIESNRQSIESLRNTSAIAFGTLTLLGGGALKVAGSFEKYNAVLANALGSMEDAADSMEMIRNTAAKTPFELDELTQSYISLVNRGFIPTQQEIIKLGDFASSQAKGFQQLVEALLDAQTGEFERLKEFGVKASKSGDQISFTFRGVTKTVTATEDAVKDYIMSLGDLQGVSGSMATISGTMEGKVSNLSDALSGLGVALGTQLLPIMKPILDKLIVMLGSVSEWVNENPKLASTIFIVVTAITGLLTVLATVALAMTTLGPIFAAIGTAVGWLAGGFTFLWGSILGPVLLVIAIVGLLYLARKNNFLGIQDIVNSVIAWFTSNVVPFFQGLIQTIVGIFTSLRNSIVSIFNSYIQIIKDVFTAFGQLFTGDREGLSLTLQNIWYNLWNIIFTMFGTSREQIKLLWDTVILYLSTAWTNLWTGVKNFFVATWNSIKEVYTGAVGAIAAFFGGGGKALIEQGFDAMIGGLVGLMKGVINGVISGFEFMVNSGINSINSLIEAVNGLGSVIGISASIPLIPTLALPRFAFGGIVEGANGIDRVPALLSPGELILNKAQQQNLAGQLQGGSGETIYITFSPQIFGSKEGLAEEIMDSFMKQFRQHTRYESF